MYNYMQGYNNPYGGRYASNPYNNGYNWGKSAQNGRYAPQRQIIRVNGENGARAYNMAPNSSVLLLDENMPIVWLAQTDGAQINHAKILESQRKRNRRQRTAAQRPGTN